MVGTYRAGGATTAAPAMAGAISGTKPYPLHGNLTSVYPLQTKRNSIKKRDNILKVKRYCILIFSSAEIIVLTLVGSYRCGLYYVSSIK